MKLHRHNNIHKKGFSRASYLGGNWVEWEGSIPSVGETDIFEAVYGLTIVDQTVTPGDA